MRLALLTFMLAVGCGQPDEDGQLNGHCYPNGTCNVTLSCVGGVCIVADAAMPDAPPVDALVPDAPPDAMCSIDSLESNNSISTATPIAQSSMTQSLTMCPTSDRDYFAVTTQANQNLEMVLSSADSNVLAISILNSGGVPIANGTPTSATQRRAYTPNLPTGTYYGVVSVATGTSTPTYDVSFTVTGP